ncbi:hypothetical protein HNQ07_000946 [Deinococcus metalli]|uniref:Uncharacterized protein n=1 Tax=Deinococcus metalli TaxID=1141878 RepID=A0A7W8NQW3_9DEIO|nr:hypothetical protein [Deinococcus metalli]MBB5375502.1 hypothetical protein [Deinococcus metalli]GHF28786.1 hypothetical protein GCM10017781_00940 [Deinococcus metalli]
MTAEAVTFPAPPRVPYPGGCVLEPGPYALDWLLKWPADITVNGAPLGHRPVYPFLMDLLADPAAHGLTPAQAQAARDRYLTLAGQALEAEGGQRAWLEREFRR